MGFIHKILWCHCEGQSPEAISAYASSELVKKQKLQMSWSFIGIFKGYKLTLA